jgi:isoquinoline 1-oxidoreductase beta subunit
MIMSKHTSIDPSDINRRQFLAAGTGLSFSLAMGSAMLPMGTSAQTNDARMAINVWVNIATDNTITILAPTAEIGQGSLTTLPLILAEELDADWSKVKVEIAPPNPKIYGNTHPLLNGCAATAQWLRNGFAKLRYRTVVVHTHCAMAA